ncbi:hypothetical protein [Arthrobacter sp. S2(2024)]
MKIQTAAAVPFADGMWLLLTRWRDRSLVAQLRTRQPARGDLLRQ